MLNEGSWVNIGTVVIMALIGAFLRFKQKSERADILKETDERLEKRVVILAMELSALKERQTNQDCQIAVMASNMKTILKSLEDIKDLIKEKDLRYSDNFKMLYDRLDNKKDKE